VWNASATDSQTHQLSIAIARRCVSLIQAFLREHEQVEAARAFYCVVREELEKLEDNKAWPQ
jgi:hypothetical protein